MKEMMKQYSRFYGKQISDLEKMEKYLNMLLSMKFMDQQKGGLNKFITEDKTKTARDFFFKKKTPSN